MQVTLEVNGSQLDQEVRDLLSTLTPEQKNTMAQQMLEKSLNSCNSEMLRKVAIKKVTEEWNEAQTRDHDRVHYGVNGDWYRLGDTYTASYDVRDKLNKRLKDMTEHGIYFRETIMKELLRTAQASVQKMVEEDPVVKEAIAATIEGIKAEMPKIVHDAMMMHFCNQMDSMSKGLANALFQSGTNAQLLTSMQEKLMQRGF